MVYGFCDNKCKHEVYTKDEVYSKEEVDLLNQDSGWIQATLNDPFQAFDNQDSNIPEYRKVGKMVEIRGIVTPKETINADSKVNIFWLPEGYRPSRMEYRICQGTGRNIWLLAISQDGTVQFGRYGVNEYIDVPASTWLPFNATFLID